MILIALLAAQPYELVAKWPDASESNYTRVFKTGEACQRARQAILAEHAQRAKAETKPQAAGGGVIYRSAPPAPIAVCVPR